MAAPSNTVWGSIVGGYGRIGLSVTRSSTNTTTSVTVQVWFWSKYSISDSGNTLYYDCTSKASSSATSRYDGISLKTSVDTGSGWSTSNQVLLKTFKYDGTSYSAFTRGKSTITKYVYAKYADVDRVGGTMYASTTFSIPALASYKISYNANGGTGAPSAQTKYYGKNLTLSSTIPTRTGYSFQGWALTQDDANDGNYYYKAGATCAANKNLTLYAVWKANTYSIKFDANGGTGAPSAQTKTYGVTLKLSTTIPTRTNYNFLGWATSKTATTATYSAGGNYTTNSGTTLYAVWELAYIRPRITNLSGIRCVETDAGLVISEEGKSALIEFDYECDQDISSVAIEWEGADKHRSITIDATEKSGHISQVIGDDPSTDDGDPNTDEDDESLSTEYTYTIRITVTDANGYTSVTTTLSGLSLAIDVLPKNEGVSFGKPAELKDHADFNYTIYPRKGFKNIPIEEGTDLYTLTEPNTYISQDNVTRPYVNCPVYGGTFKMEVTSGGMEGQIHQTLTYTNKNDFKIYHCQYHSGSWGDWKCVYSLNGNMLWDGSTTSTNGYYMTSGQVCDLSQKISDQPNGIVLIFSRFDSESNTAANEQIVEHVVYKKTVNLLPGNGHSVPLFTPWANAVKYLYINDTSVAGHEKNNQSFTVGGIEYTNKYFVLRYVIGF